MTRIQVVQSAGVRKGLHMRGAAIYNLATADCGTEARGGSRSSSVRMSAAYSCAAAGLVCAGCTLNVTQRVISCAVIDRAAGHENQARRHSTLRVWAFEASDSRCLSRV